MEHLRWVGKMGRMTAMKQLWRGFGWLLVLGVVAGAILYWKMRENYVQVSPDLAEPSATFVLLLGIPATLLALWAVPSLNSMRDAKNRHTGVVRSFQTVLSVPVGAIMIAYSFAIAPIGWCYLWGYLIGSEISGVQATVVDSEPLRSFAKGCGQRFVLLIGGRHERVCAESHVVGTLPTRGQVVRIRGTLSPVGIWVKEIRLDQ